MWYQIIAKCSNAAERRKRAWHHFYMMFVDILDIPFAIAILVITITLWRAINLWKSLLAAQTRKEGRKIVIRQTLCWLMDIPTALAVFLLVITVYRARGLFKDLKEIWNRNGWFAPVHQSASSASSRIVVTSYTDRETLLSSNNNEANEADPEAAEIKGADPEAYPEQQLDQEKIYASAVKDLEEESPAPPPRSWTYHVVVAKHLGLLLLDLPLPLLVFLTLWRMPWLIRRLRKEVKSILTTSK